MWISFLPSTACFWRSPSASCTRGPSRTSATSCWRPASDLKNWVHHHYLWVTYSYKPKPSSDDTICLSCAGVQPVPLQNITNENPAGPSLGTIPQARFLLAMLHMLTLKHGANSLSLLLNSGTLALTQCVLRLIGQVHFHFSGLFTSKPMQECF